MTPLPTRISRVRKSRRASLFAVLEPGEATPRVGTEMVIRAVSYEGKALSACLNVAWVTSPSGSVESLLLYDDGEQDDGTAGDGIFARRHRKTSEAGAYHVKVLAVCERQDGTLAKREQSLSMYLKQGRDSDSDGIPDWWERVHGLDEQADSGATARSCLL